MKHADRGFVIFNFSNMLLNTPDPIVTVIGLLPLPHDDTSWELSPRW